MGLYPSIAKGTQTNILQGLVRGAAAGQQMQQSKTRNALANRKDRQAIAEARRKRIADLTANALESGNPQQARAVIAQNRQYFIEDEQDAQALDQLLQADDNTFMSGLQNLYKASRAAPEYGAPTTVSKGGKNVLARFSQYGTGRTIEGYGPEKKPGAETYGPMEEIPGRPGYYGQRGSVSGKYVNVLKPSGKKGGTGATKRSGPDYELTPSDENTIAKGVAAYFAGKWDPGTNTFIINDVGLRKKANAVNARATRIYLDAKRRGKKYEITRREAVKRATDEYEAMARKPVPGGEGGPYEVDAITGAGPKPRGGIKFLGFE